MVPGVPEIARSCLPFYSSLVSHIGYFERDDDARGPGNSQVLVAYYNLLLSPLLEFWNGIVVPGSRELVNLYIS